jgi:hypothetical protein
VFICGYLGVSVFPFAFAGYVPVVAGAAVTQKKAKTQMHPDIHR